MATIKLQQEVDKCFEKVVAGVASFEAIHNRIGLLNSPSQRRELENSLEREIRKLQDWRFQIKIWAASDYIKSQVLLPAYWKLIYEQAVKFEAMTEALFIANEIISATAKLFPKEEDNSDVGELPSSMLKGLEQQIEVLNAAGKPGERVRAYTTDSLTVNLIRTYEDIDLGSTPPDHFQIEDLGHFSAAASPSHSLASSFGSIDSGVSHPPQAKTKGKKVMSMQFSQFVNHARTWTGDSEYDDYDQGAEPPQQTNNHATGFRSSSPQSKSDGFASRLRAAIGASNSLRNSLDQSLAPLKKNIDEEEDWVQTRRVAISTTHTNASEAIPDSNDHNQGSTRNGCRPGLSLPKVTGLPTRRHWKHDTESFYCGEITCKRSFNYFTRRHHCRKCGNIFCDKHSNFRVPLDQDANFNPTATPSRTCGDCFGEFQVWCLNNIVKTSNSNIPPT